MATFRIQSSSTFDCTCQRYAMMIGLRTLRTLPFSSRSLSSVNNGRVAIHRSPVFGSTQTRCFGCTRHYRVLDVEPSHDPEHINALFTNVDHCVLHGELSLKLGCSYLSRIAKTLKPMPEINGILFGVHSRPLFALATTYNRLSYHLYFLFDTSSPFTYLSYNVS